MSFDSLSENSRAGGVSDWAVESEASEQHNVRGGKEVYRSGSAVEQTLRISGMRLVKATGI